MGYPMTYPRVIGRNRLAGDYQPSDERGMIRGDLRRLEQDTLDERYGAQIAKTAGVTPEVARAVLIAFFSDCGGAGWIPPDWTPPASNQESGSSK